VSDNTARTVIVFSLIGIILLGFAIGGVRFMKARNDSLASNHSQPAKPQSTPEQKPSDTKKPEDSKPASNNPAPSTPTPPSQPSVPQQNPSTPPASPSDSSVAAAGPQSVAATGPTDIVVSLVLLMSAVFFASQIVRARADCRRYIRQS
jgi:outer membrane biosynthesis protein TonB